MKKKKKKFLTDGSIRCLSAGIALFILFVPLSVKRIFKSLPAKNTKGLHLELLCFQDTAEWENWTKWSDPGEFYAFSRSPEGKYPPLGTGQLSIGSLRSHTAPALPRLEEITLPKLRELPRRKDPLQGEVIPLSVRNDEEEIPPLRSLEVCDASGTETGLVIAPVPFHNALPRPVLFKVRSARCGNDLLLMQSSGDHAFDSGVRNQLLQKPVSAVSGKLLCVWPKTTAGEAEK